MKDNKLIAEFMGLKYYEPFFEVTDESQMEKIEVRKGKVISFGYMFEPHELRYHESWDWLIPVVQKLIDVYISIDEQDEKDLSQNILYGYISKPSVKDVYKLIVKFINEYNNNI